MKIGIVVGSQRKQSESAKVARYISSVLQNNRSGLSTYLLDLGESPLPFFDTDFWDNAPRWQTIWKPIDDALLSCDGFVVVSPEWGGMVPGALKNFFLLAGNQHLGHKPGLLVAVSATRGGAYPVAELRSSSYKNNRICFIPEHIIVRNVGEVLNNENLARNEKDFYIRDRIQYALRLLIQYSHALRAVRESGVIDDQTYPYGM